MSANVLVVAETQTGPDGGAALAPITFELFGAAHQLLAAEGSGIVAAVVAGSNIHTLAADLAAYGAGRVYVADDPSLAAYLGEAYVPVVEQAIRQAEPDVVLLGHTSTGRDLGARLAFRLGCGLVTDCTGLRVEAPAAGGDSAAFASRLVITKPVYGGSAVAEYAPAGGACQFVTLRPRAFQPAQAHKDAGPLELVELPIAAAGAAAARARVVDVVREAATGPRLKEAKIVVSGGRGLGGPEHWHYVEELAAALGAAVGATRAVTDAGWVPPSHQVGLTGTTVTPDLYVAAGISGAVQHVAGCSGSRTIVAINRDPDANIFKHARYGVVGDVRQVLPALTDRIKQLRGTA